MIAAGVGESPKRTPPASRGIRELMDLAPRNAQAPQESPVNSAQFVVPEAARVVPPIQASGSAGPANAPTGAVAQRLRSRPPGYPIPGAHPRGPFPSSKLRWKRNLRWAHPWTEAFPDAAGVVILQHPVERLSLLDHGQHLLDKLPPTLRKRRRRGGRQTCRARTHRASDGRALRLPAFQHIKEGSPEEIEETGHK